MTRDWWLPIGDYPAQIIVLDKDGWTKPLACCHA